jgi:NAD(P)-dependent dehydrogenase (short-subunit alcohol dehydrogenase family)
MEERMPQLPRVTPDMVGTLKTLGQICDYLAGRDRSGKATSTSDPLTGEPCQPVLRQIVDVVPCPKGPGRPFKMAPQGWIAVLDDASALARSLIVELEKRQTACRLVAADAPHTPDRFDGAAGLIICAQTTAEKAFLAAQQAAPHLMAAAGQGDALFAVITTMDGAFGFSGHAFETPEQGALPGLLKTAALEWPPVVCRAIDLSGGLSRTDAAARQVAEELLSIADSDVLEIGLGFEGRVTLKPVPAETVDGPLRLASGQVVVVTGGARGVTAACALSLARSSGAAIALVGRSAPPFAEPAWLRGTEGEAAMKQAIAANDAFADSRPTPKALQAAYDKYIANRSIKQTVAELQAVGVAAGYYRADVSDRAALDAAIEAIRDQMGPIAGLIHAAGLIHDRLIVDKTVDQFRKVYAVKVDGLKHLLAATAGDRLSYLVLFSSVSARTGNTGQCDYAMANEALNKIARSVALQRPECRVSAINWGPWDGGMVTPALKKTMADKAVDLIPVEVGAAMMVAEMKHADPGPVEVLIGSMMTSAKTPVDDYRPPDAAAMALLERREIDLQRYPVLASHVIGGKPVVPFALISEWIGHGAVKDNPGFSLHGIDDFRLLSGIRLEAEKKLVRLMAGKARKAGNTWAVDVELRNGVKNGRDVIHSRARALLVDRFPEPPLFEGNGKNGHHPYPRDLESVYEEILFHGTGLRAIRSIESYAEDGMTARLVNAPKPEAWMQDPIQERWMADPMVLDGAFQMAIVWCYEKTGSVCLPSYARAYRQYRQCFPEAGVTAVMSVSASTPRKLVADFTFLDDDRTVVATLSGYEATVDNSLIHSFRENVLKTVITGNMP